MKTHLNQCTKGLRIAGRLSDNLLFGWNGFRLELDFRHRRRSASIGDVDGLENRRQADV